MQWFGTNTDIEILKQAEITAVRLAAIVESSSDAVIGKEFGRHHHQLERCRRGGCFEVFGRRDCGSLDPALIVPPATKTKKNQILSKIKRGERVGHFETRAIVEERDDLIAI